ncbi:MAG: amidase [Chloroflexota bacterium]
MTALQVDATSSATEMLVALRAGRLSSRELLDLLLDRIRQYNERLNAVILVDEDGAGVAAGDADRARAGGDDRSLLGLPITIKDSIDVAGLPTVCGVRRRQDHRADRDAAVVASARRAGAVTVGKTNTPPYTGDWQTDNSVFGRTNNPWDLNRTPGGSTGGGAAAVAAGLSPLELGSDIGGSIRVPAAFCGIYGHRPSDTLVPRTGHYPGSPLPNVGGILNVIGPLARSAADLELALDVIAGPEAGEDVAWRIELPPARHTRLSQFRVAVLPPLDWLPVDSEIEAALDSVVEALRRAGARVERIAPETFGNFREAHLFYGTLLLVMYSFNVGGTAEDMQRHAEDAMGNDDERLGPARELLGSAHALLRAYARRERYRAAYREFFREWDVLLSPVAPVTAFEHHTNRDAPFLINGREVPYGRLSVYPGVATLCGQPATAFPAGFTQSHLPIGLQAVGPYLEDRTPIRFAQLLAEEIGGYEPPAL